MLYSCWTLLRRFASTDRFRERLTRVFRILAIFIPLSNCSSHSLNSYGHHLRHFSGGFPSPVQTYILSFVEDRDSFSRLYLSVIIHAYCRGEQLQYWLYQREQISIMNYVHQIVSYHTWDSNTILVTKYCFIPLIYQWIFSSYKSSILLTEISSYVCNYFIKILPFKIQSVL